jgi:hypothetical protein
MILSPEMQIIVSFIAVAVFIALILTLNLRKQGKLKVLICIWIILFGALMTFIIVSDMISNGIEIIDSTSDSWHIGLILGLPALISLSIGTILVLYDEHKYVVWHGYFAGGSLILTIINIILLVFLTPSEILSYSGLIHTLHIMFGAVGLMTGCASFLFGASGQRNLARLTGYFTLAGWWGAFLLGLFL